MAYNCGFNRHNVPGNGHLAISHCNCKESSMSLRLRSAFTAVLVTLFTFAAFAATVPRDGSIAPIQINRTSIEWKVQVPMDGFTLRVTRPDGETYATESASRRPSLTVADLG